MIIFQGDLSSKCKQYVSLQNRKATFIIAWISAALLLIPTILLSIFWEWIVIFFTIPLLLAPFIAKISAAKTDDGWLYPTKIEIDTQENPPLLLAVSDKFHVLRNSMQIKHIIDMGDWYVFVFRFPYKAKQFVCEKVLLCQGTVREFEEIFKDEIVSQLKKQGHQNRTL